MNGLDLYGAQSVPTAFRWESQDMLDRREFWRLVSATLFWAAVSMSGVIAGLTAIPGVLAASELIG